MLVLVQGGLDERWGLGFGQVSGWVLELFALEKMGVQEGL